VALVLSCCQPSTILEFPYILSPWIVDLSLGLRTVKQTSDFAKGKIEAADTRLKQYGLRGVVLLFLAIPVGLVAEFLDSFAGLVAALVLGASGFVLIVVGLSFWMEQSNTRKGVQGEESVAWELSYLSDEFLLLNDLMLPGSKGNIDHVVVGPTGVFVVETKNYSGKYVCYGDRWFFQGIRQKYDVSSVSVQARNNARVLADLLHSSGFTVDVSPIIVFTHPSVQLWLHSPTVQVLKSGAICNYLLNQRPRFQLTEPYSQKVAEKILAKDRPRHSVLPGPIQ